MNSKAPEDAEFLPIYKLDVKGSAALDEIDLCVYISQSIHLFTITYTPRGKVYPNGSHDT